MAYKYKPNRKTDPRRYNAALSFSEFCPPRHDVVGPRPEWRGLCRCGCGTRLPKGFRQWADPAHAAKVVEQYRLIKGHSATIRRLVFARDRGLCALCGLDCPAESRRCFVRWDAPEAQQQAAKRQRERFMLRGFPPPRQSGKAWWQADHITPVVEGGQHTMENLRTLCCLCHRLATAELAAKRARSRRPRRAPLTYGKFAVSRETALATGPAPRMFAPQPTTANTTPCYFSR